MAVSKIGVDDRFVAHDLRRLSFGENLTEMQHDGAVDERHDDFHHMLDHQDGDALIPHAADEGDAGLRLGRRQARHHFVEEQKPRLCRQGAGHFEPAFFPAG